jgi:CRISPR-associated protein Cas2
MNVHPMVFLVCYDIRDPDRLRRVHRVMRGWGDPVQYSVFRCVLSPRQRVWLESELLDVLNQADDQVMIVPLGAPDGVVERRIRTLGQPLKEAERVCQVF